MMDREKQETLAMVTFWVVIALCFLSMMSLKGCAGSQHYHYVNIGTVEGTAWIRDIGSRGQMAEGANSWNLGIPIDGVPLKARAEGESPLQGTVIYIDRIGGDLFYDKAFVGTQGVDLPDAIDRLYQYGDPFDVTP